MDTPDSPECLCGSGKPSDACCTVSGRTQDTFTYPSPEQILKEKFGWEQHYGKVRPIISAIHQSRTRLIAVGNELMSVPVTCTPADFFARYYMSNVFDPEWGNAEIDKPDSERHILLTWYKALGEHIKSLPSANGVAFGVPVGWAAAYAYFAYDLYLLGHNSQIQKSLVARLKVREQFQGAFYEVYVAAAMVRAGFEMAFEDESDPSMRHPEFVATHKATGQRVAVEAKSRHRPGIMGHPGDQKTTLEKVGVRRLLEEAAGKSPGIPYIVFIDLNLGSIDEVYATGELSRKIDEEARLALGRYKGNDCPVTYVLFTNSPHPTGGLSVEPPKPFVKWMRIPNSAFPLEITGVFDEVLRGVMLYGRIPNYFLSEDGLS